VLGDTGTGHNTLIHANVETMRVRNPREYAHRLLGDSANLCHFFGGRLVVGADVAVRADQEVSTVVWKEVQQRVRGFSSVDYQSI
jgi:hypothetical protein